MNIGDQFKAIIERKAQGLGQASEEGARLISEQVKTNTLSGTGFGDDRYDNNYAPKVAKKKGRESPVTLRNGRSRIENQTVTIVGESKAQIRFSDSEGGKIFRYHHEGINYSRVGLRVRSVFPKRAESVPTGIKSAIKAKAHEVLSK